VTVEGRNEGAREVILAIFRLAVADYLGHSFSHDGDTPIRRTRSRGRCEAANFLVGRWAAFLADLIGLDSDVVWREARVRGERSTGETQRHIAA
jgi:hypothetical protein